MKKISIVILFLVFFSSMMSFGFINEDIHVAEKGDPEYEINIIGKGL